MPWFCWGYTRALSPLELAERALVAVLWLLCLHRLGRLLFFSGVAAGSQVWLPLCGSVLELVRQKPADTYPNLGAPVAACRGFFLERQKISRIPGAAISPNGRDVRHA